jgi:hypothetical protein
VVDLVAIDIDERVLVLGLKNPRANRNVLRGLHVQRDAPDRLRRSFKRAITWSTPTLVLLEGGFDFRRINADR